MRRTIGIALLLAATLPVGGLAAGLGARPQRAGLAEAAARRPNIIFILTDDLSWNLINRQFTPHILALQQRGETFNHYFVADTLCCPSRATIFTGLFPHDTKVLANVGAVGGYRKFQSERLDKKTFAVALRSRGYRTAMLGKYLNGYGDPVMTRRTAPVPPGWSDWHVSNRTGYREFNYVLNDNGRIHRYGGAGPRCQGIGTPDNYGVDVLLADARSLIDTAHRQPFMLELATFAPHAPYVPAPRNACDFPGLNEPRDASFNRRNINPPAWLAARRPLTDRKIEKIDQSFRLRAQSVEAVDTLLAVLERTLAADHLTRNTYIVFSSDNGYHMGQHELLRGKKTAFDTDVRVPLIITGPGVPAGRVVSQVTQNVDLYPTFLQLGGGRPNHPVDGHSLVPLLHPATVRPRWRTVALIEHHHFGSHRGDPDFEDGKLGGDPTTYEAIRISTRHLRGFSQAVEAVYVEYKDGEREYYNIAKDPFERDNIAQKLTLVQRAELHGILLRLENCHTASACWSAGMPG